VLELVLPPPAGHRCWSELVIRLVGDRGAVPAQCSWAGCCLA